MAAPRPPSPSESTIDGLIGRVSRATPAWLRHLPPEDAILGVLALGVIFGLVSAALRRPEDELE